MINMTLIKTLQIKVIEDDLNKLKKIKERMKATSWEDFIRILNEQEKNG